MDFDENIWKLTDFPENPTNDQIKDRAKPILKQVYIQALEESVGVYRNTFGDNFITDIQDKINQLKGE